MVWVRMLKVLAMVALTITLLMLAHSHALFSLMSGQESAFVIERQRGQSPLDVEVEKMPTVITALDHLERMMLHVEQMSSRLIRSAQLTSTQSTVNGIQLPELEQSLEAAYWFQRQELDKLPSPHFSGLEPNWPCFWGKELVGGDLGDAGRWICGAGFLRDPCVMYSFRFGNAGNSKFELAVAGFGCAVHIHDPTDAAPEGLEELSSHFHSVTKLSYVQHMS